MKDVAPQVANIGKFRNKTVTAKGEARASVALSQPQTLWFNTGTLCNITCTKCYIKSSPTNDALVFLNTGEVEDYLNQIATRKWPVHEIGFTGGEPFMNPDIIAMTRAALSRGFDVLLLTNAMRPMMRPDMRAGLVSLQRAFGDRLTLRVSVDHFTAKRHDSERGTGSFAKTLHGMQWLRDNGLRMTVAGRVDWATSEASARAGFAALYKQHGFAIDPQDPGQTLLFPEMDETVEVPEITTSCWSILNKNPKDVMCASSRMVVKRKGTTSPVVLACTLLPYSAEFELGKTLAEAEGDVHLNHPHCAKFCVLGGASCSA